MKKIVAKFGGTSMADTEAILKSAQIAIDRQASVIVVSAIAGTTDLLNQLLKLSAEDSARLLIQISDQHLKIARELNASDEVNSYIAAELSGLEEIINGTESMRIVYKRYRDSVLPIGEKIVSGLMVAALEKLGHKSVLFDAKKVMKTDNHYGFANPSIEKVKQNTENYLRPLLAQNKTIVTQGYIGSAADGSTTTLGRGGSDYTAALLAEALEADELQIWTNVSGIYTTDPGIDEHARQLSSISFQEASELATAGAKVLHNSSIWPMRRSGKPILVANTFDPDTGGTMIIPTTDEKPIVRAIVIKSDQVIIRITTATMAGQHGYLAKLFEIFAAHKISLNQISTSEITVAVAVDKEQVNNRELFADLEQMGTVSLEEELDALSVIGNNINKTPSLVKDIFNSLEARGDKISIRMICQGASQHNICFFVHRNEGEKAVRQLHKKFIEDAE